MTQPGEAIGHTETFPLYGGRSSLNLVATLGKRHTEPFERLVDRDALAEWLVLAGLLSAELAERPIAEGQLQDARDLREVVYRLVRATMDGRPLDAVDVELINDTAAGPDLAPQLTSDDSGLPGQGACRVVGRPVDAALSTVARDAIQLLTGPRTSRIKKCENPDCSILFFDDSQSGNRRWCSMDRCGNLAKIGGYRKRKSTPVQ
jgi:predicted RNA-binding Zn ribbon-like protein